MELMMMPVRAIAFDLDDTLLRDDRTVSDESVRILRLAAAEGIRVIPASGRAQHSMEAIVERIGCASLYIACNGAEIWSPRHELLSRVTMDAETAREVGRFAREHDCYAQTYSGDRFLYSRRGFWAERYAEATLLEGVYVGELDSAITEPTSKILLSDDPARIARLLLEARELFRGNGSVEVMNGWITLTNDWAFTAYNPDGSVAFCYPFYGLSAGD